MTAGPDIDFLLREAAVACRNRSFAQCRAFANRAIALDRGHFGALHFLLLAALGLERGDEVNAVLSHAQAVAGRAAMLLNGALLALLESGDHAALEFAWRVIPERTIGWIVALYYRGCSDIALGDHAAALRRFTTFRRAVPAFGPVIDFMDGGSFNVMFRQGVTVGDAATVAQRLATPVPEGTWPPPPVVLRRADGEAASDVVFFASCNRPYFDHLAGKFLAALAALPVPRAVHLHVADPGDGIEARFAELTAGLGLPAGLSVEPPSRYRTSTYFACSRFYVAPVLLEVYRRPMVSLDIDIAVTPAIDRVLAGAGEVDFACFNTGRREPASVYQASVMVFRDTPAGRDFVDALGRYCLPRLDEPDSFNWMLDQAALISVKSWFESAGRPLRFGELDRSSGLALGDLCLPLCSDDDKQALKYRARLSQLQDDTESTWTPD